MKTLLPTSLGAALCALALAGCDAGSPPGAVVAPENGERAASVTGGTLLPVLRDEDPYARARALGGLLPMLGPEALPEVTGALRDPTLALGGAEYELLIRFWASQEPEQATRWAVEASPPFYRDAVLMTALPYWVAADLQAVLVASEKWQTARPEVREALARGTVLGWYAAGLPGLAQYIQDQGGGFARQLALATYSRAVIIQEGAQTVMDWAASVPEDDESYKLSVYRQVASALALLDRAAAMRWCEAQCDSAFGNNMRSLIAGRWVLDDGPSALGWLSTAPEGHEKDLTIMTTLDVWGRKDRDATLAWMTEQIDADGEMAAWLRPALPVYARLLAEQSFLAERSPAEALEWAQRIEKVNQREFALITIARKWRESDEAANEAWLQESPLSEDARAKVRDPNWTPSQR